jgi:hypothetical protein
VFLGFDSIKSAVSKKLQGVQYAFGTKGGVERIIHALQAQCEKYKTDPSFMIASVDFSNAFNTLSRRAIFDTVLSDPDLVQITRLLYFAYSCPSPLFILDENKNTQTLLLHLV